MQVHILNYSEYRKYNGLYSLLNKVDLPFSVQVEIRNLFASDPDLRGVDIENYSALIYQIGLQILRSRRQLLSLPELTLLTKFALKKWSGISIIAKGKPRKIVPQPLHKGHFHVSRKRRIWNESKDFVKWDGR